MPAAGWCLRAVIQWTRSTGVFPYRPWALLCPIAPVLAPYSSTLSWRYPCNKNPPACSGEKNKPSLVHADMVTQDGRAVKNEAEVCMVQHQHQGKPALAPDHFSKLFLQRHSGISFHSWLLTFFVAKEIIIPAHGLYMSYSMCLTLQWILHL